MDTPSASWRCPASRGLGRLHDEVLGQVHAVGEVPERAVRLQGGELRAVAGVYPLVSKVAGDLEDPLVTAHDQALEIELRGDPEAELGVEGIGVCEEGTCQGAAGLGLQDRGLDLHEALGLKALAAAWRES